MRKPTAHKIKSVLETHLGDKFTKAGYRRAKRAYMKLTSKQKARVG